METEEQPKSVGCGEYGIEKDDFMKYAENANVKKFKTLAMIFLSAAFYSIAFHYFISPGKFAPGGIGGILAMAQFLFKTEKISVGIDFSPFLFALLNLPVLAVAYRRLSKKFVINTAITVALISVLLFALDNLDPEYKFSIISSVDEKDDVGVRLVAAFIGGALCGVSLAFAFKVDASTGGSDIVGAMIQKKNPHISIGNILFAVNGVILAASFFVYKDNFMPIFLSLIYLTVDSQVCDMILQGAKKGLKFEVITEHPEEISREVIVTLGHGVTVTPAVGMFEHKNKTLLICIIKPRQIAKFQRIISKYPETFAYVGQVNEIIGKFNDTKKETESE